MVILQYQIKIKMFQNIALYSSNVTIIMVAVFGLVCLVLIGFLVKFMTSSDKKKSETND
jgi:heme/copper-type cytochrome/quinol oxidase subunit 2